MVGRPFPTNGFRSRRGRPTLLTCGLLAQARASERVIEVMGSLGDLPGRPRYLVARPDAPEGAGRRRRGDRDARSNRRVPAASEDSVFFDNGYRNVSMLTDLIQSAAVVVLPYDSTRSGHFPVLLVDAIGER